ncbi:hypothetical protein GCM10009745_57230 [Kribbella yunnanensis]|uniref:FxLD family lantipeptide n=1 Tax=Kribbella yunnanensis TaxID=190194 RepID=A0ABN2ICL1_9ACTN
MPNVTSDEFDLDIRLTPQDVHGAAVFVTSFTSRPSTGAPCCTDNCCPN